MGAFDNWQLVADLVVAKVCDLAAGEDGIPGYDICGCCRREFVNLPRIVRRQVIRPGRGQVPETLSGRPE